MKTTLLGIGTAAVLGLMMVGNASAEGVCVGICIGATPAPDVWNPTNTQANAEACVGNAVVQIGVQNTNTMCNGSQYNQSCQVKGDGDVNCSKVAVAPFIETI